MTVVEALDLHPANVGSSAADTRTSHYRGIIRKDTRPNLFMCTVGKPDLTRGHFRAFVSIGVGTGGWGGGLGP